jgi:tripartite-type tricarboxylate transporter receptor subunit TctC
MTKIIDYEDYKTATHDEKDEYIFNELKKAFESDDWEKYQRAFELMFWEIWNRQFVELMKKETKES